MSKKSKAGGKEAANLLRLSGIIFGIVGIFHVLRYFAHWDFRVGGFELTYIGSLVVGALILWLSVACFLNAGSK